MRRRLLNLVDALLLVLAAGCAAREPAASRVSPRAERPVAPLVRTAAAPAQEDLYWEVDEGEAETVLVATVRSGRGVYTRDVPLRRYPPGQYPREPFIAPTTGSADGESFEDRVSLAVVDDATPGVMVRVRLRAASLAQFLLGAGWVSCYFTIPVGLPSEFQLPEDATLSVRFRPPAVHDAEATTGPQPWERRLEADRSESDDVPIPPAWKSK